MLDLQCKGYQDSKLPHLKLLHLRQALSMLQQIIDGNVDDGPANVEGTNIDPLSAVHLSRICSMCAGAIPISTLALPHGEVRFGRFPLG